MERITEPVVYLRWEADPLQHLETCGRVCYNSFLKRTNDSAEPFIDNLIKAGHLSVLEHAAVNINHPDFKIQFDDIQEDSPEFGLLMARASLGSVRFSDMIKYDSRFNTAADLRKLPRATDVMTFDMDNVSRSFTHQLVRHRNLSFSQQSLRFVKFTEKTFKYVSPFADNEPEEFTAHMLNCIRLYEKLLAEGQKPDQARSVLPLCTATSIIATGQASWWFEFLKLRYHPRASKEMIKVAKRIYELCPEPIHEKADELGLLEQFKEADDVAKG